MASDSSLNLRRALGRALLIAFLGFLCLSNVYVQGQATTGTSGSTTSGVITSTSTAGGTGTPGTGTATASGTPASPTSPLPSRSPSDPLGHLTMLQPKPNVKNPPLFPLGTDLVFAWQYDQYLILPPSNITIEAYIGNTIITIGNALPGNTKNYTWPAASQLNATNPIKDGIYTIRVFDGQVGRWQRLPEGGYLETYDGLLKIGLYSPRPYTPGKDNDPPVCATCEFSKVTNSVMKNVVPLSMALLVLMTTFVVLL
ncbi:hypothetical protein BGX28_008068 [Mortierella sp. GBA30]|nr:hypothetical protein BGX28_008068 [Mortierella sp. GBA30]